MDDISGAAVAGLLSMVGLGWLLHVRGEEPGEFALFLAVLLGLFFQATGRAAWVPWLWFGASAMCLVFYAVDWTRGWGRRSSHPPSRRTRTRED